MSKASEWLKASSKMVYWYDEEKVAVVNSDGNFALVDTVTLSPTEAIEFAHWIIDVFGEPEGGGREGDGDE